MQQRPHEPVSLFGTLMARRKTSEKTKNSGLGVRASRARIAGNPGCVLNPYRYR
jgi:hypothetical protein